MKGQGQAAGHAKGWLCMGCAKGWLCSGACKGLVVHSPLHGARTCIQGSCTWPRTRVTHPRAAELPPRPPPGARAPIRLVTSGCIPDASRLGHSHNELAANEPEWGGGDPAGTDSVPGITHGPVPLAPADSLQGAAWSCSGSSTQHVWPWCFPHPAHISGPKRAMSGAEHPMGEA